ncbi:MAG TPA: hypothetical protein VFA05_06780 [Gaiellaceae bacterium]|nr:hypothetical protein [Gaiellaceae bacterium]
MTSAIRAGAVCAVAAAALGLGPARGSAGAQTPRFVFHRVVFVAVSGQGRVTSDPAGIACPRVCRSRTFVKDQTVTLVAHPAAGWTVGAWSGSCTGRGDRCTFMLTDAHDCARGMCPIGAFGERVAFVRRNAG